jgi:hypothetical protein
MRRGGRTVRGSGSLVASLVLMVVATVLAAGLAELGRTELVLARQRRVASEGLAAADACVADVVAALPAGWDFAETLAGPDGVAGTPDDGGVAAPAGCTATLAPGPAGALRPLLDVAVVVPGGGRTVEAVLARRTEPGGPGLVWTASPATPGSVGGTLLLDARGGSAPAVAGPGDPLALDGWLGATPGATVAAPAPAFAPAPPLAALSARLAAAGAAPTLALAPIGGPPPPPRLTRVAGDLTLATPGVGAGLLFIDGILDIGADFSFSGVVAAAGGVRLASGASFTVDGSLWLGAPAGAALDLAGTATVRDDAAAVAAADALLPLPRRAVVAGMEDR